MSESGKPRADRDWYVEDEFCHDLLHKHVQFDGPFVDPCAGMGTSILVARRLGLVASGWDISPRSEIIDNGGDFLEWRTPCMNIVMNPPYRKGVPEAFISKALALTAPFKGKVAVLVQQKFPFSEGRNALFTMTPLARLYFFSSRPSMPPGDMLVSGEMKRGGGKMDYLWMVWDHKHSGAPTCHWLLREDKERKPRKRKLSPSQSECLALIGANGVFVTRAEDGDAYATMDNRPLNARTVRSLIKEGLIKPNLDTALFPDIEGSAIQYTIA